MPTMKVLGEAFYRELGRKLREVRVQAGLKQEATGLMIGFKPGSGQAYLSRLEKGHVHGVELDMIVRYLRACKAPVGRWSLRDGFAFMLELAQSGAFGEAEARISSTDSTDYTDRGRIETEKRAKAKLLYQKRWEREARDADIVARVWAEVRVAIQPLLPSDPSRRQMVPNLEGVRAFYRAWKQAVRGAVNRDPTLDVQMAFDRIEEVGVRALVPAAVRKMREIVFERLMAMKPG